MIVVSDTTPLNYLVLIGVQEILPRLFGQVYIPPAVIEELKHSKAPESVRRWAESPPEWVVVRAPQELDSTLPSKIHRGETQALSLTKELQAEWVLIDDWDARQAAKARNLPLAGTPDILEEAACRGMLDIEETVEKLRRTNYRATEEQYRVTIENVRVRLNAQTHDHKIQGVDEPAPSLD
jgi:predicted nucleic acid-binding protein